MNSRHFISQSLLPLLLAATVVGCGDDGSSSSSGGSGAGGGASAVLRGAANYRFGKTLDGQCDRVTNPNAGVGSVTGGQSSPVTNGQGGAMVSCKMVPDGSGFAVTLIAATGSERFSLAGTISPDQESPVKVTVYSADTGAPYSSAASKPCKAWVMPDETNPSLGISAGKVWGAFRCDEVFESGNTNTTPCGILNGNDKAPGGYFVFEGCSSQ